MATPIDQIGQHELNPTLKALAKAGGTTEHADWIRAGSGSNAAWLIQAINEKLGFPAKNPHEMTVDEQLTALRRASDEENWGITNEDFARLASTAPEWPKGNDACRSFRIRFGNGSEGVAKTFEAHCARIRRVFGNNSRLRGVWMSSAAYVKTLRLLSGNHTHEPVVEWIIADLDTHRERSSILAVRDSKSLADELLVIVWMFPDMLRAIDPAELQGFFAAGYEFSPSPYESHEWTQVVLVYFQYRKRRVCFGAGGKRNRSIHYSVPVLREPPALCG